MILWRNIEIFHFESDPRFPPFLLHVRWKSGVTFVRRCFRNVYKHNKPPMVGEHDFLLTESAHITHGGTMPTARPELPYRCISKAKSHDETSRRVK